MFDFIKSISLEEINEDNIQNIKTCTELILHILNTSQSNFDNSKALIDVMGFLNCEEFLIKVPGLINSISKLNEYWMTKVQMKEKILGMEYTTLKHLLTLCTLDKSSVSRVFLIS